MFFRVAIRTLVAIMLIAGVLLPSASPVYAQDAIKKFQAGAGEAIKKTGVNEASGTTELPRLAGTLIGKVLSLIGVVFFLITLIAGFFWMFSLGNENRERAAKDTIVAAVGGLIVIIGSYAITDFVFKTVGQKDAAPAASTLTSTDACGNGSYVGALCVDPSRCQGGQLFPNATGCTAGQVCCMDAATSELK